MAITRKTANPRVGNARQERRPGFASSVPQCCAGASSLRQTAVLLTGVWALSAPTANADTFRVVPSLGLVETLTNNVSLAPSGSARSDLVTQLTPVLSISETGARTRLNGTVSLPIVLYARSGSQNDQVYAQAALSGTVEAVEKFFFIDGSILVSQQYFSPFGAQPSGLTNATQNRYTAASYSFSPYITGHTFGDVEYLVRDENTWTKLNGAPTSGVSGAYTNHALAKVSKQAAPTGWAVDYDRTSVKFGSQPPLLTQAVRLHLLHTLDPQLQLSTDVGYEDDDYGLTKNRATIYGVGAAWHPTDRTNVEATWEHRFFGSSYVVNFTHRTPLTVWNLNASRNITTYPQQLAALPAGSDVQSLLSQLFVSSIPDALQRQAFVDQFIRDRGLPGGLLSNPVYLYGQQITLQEQASASVGLIGARNSIFFSAFHLRQRPLASAGNDLPGFIAAQNNNTQEGVSAVWTHSLAPTMTFALMGNVARGESDVPPSGNGNVGTTRQGSLSATLTSPLSANTSASAGVRYQVLRSDLATSYTEAAAFVALNHTFR